LVRLVFNGRGAVKSESLEGRQKQRRDGLPVDQGAACKTGVEFSPTDAWGQIKTGNVGIYPVNQYPSQTHALYFNANPETGCSCLAMLLYI
jgi:hypothetical protein